MEIIFTSNRTGGDSVTLSAKRIPYFSPPDITRPLQRSVRTYSGKIVTSDVATTVVNTEFIIRNILPSQFYQWKRFIVEETVWNLYSFDVEVVDVPNLDIGIGRGNNTIEECHWREEFNSFTGLVRHRAPDRFDITIPLTFTSYTGHNEFNWVV